MRDLSTEEILVASMRLIEDRDLKTVSEILSILPDEDRTGNAHAMLGLACFMLERYSESLAIYEQAIMLEPENRDWQLMKDKAQTNSIARIDLLIPPLTVIPPASLHKTHLPMVKYDVAPDRILKFMEPLRQLPGQLLAGSMKLITGSWGHIAGYHGDIWTNWYQRPLLPAILTLVYMRDRLNRYCLWDVYPARELTGFAAAGEKVPHGVHAFRTADGSWNNLENPLEGAAGVRFSRNISSEVTKPETGERLMSPNPREVSRKLLHRGDQMQEIPFLNLLTAAWIQFQTHDWVSHGENIGNGEIEISLEEDDPVRKRYCRSTMKVARTQTDPTRQPQGEPVSVTHLNEVTHWWDASQIYGSDQETVDRLRLHQGGFMQLDENGLLPLDAQGIEDAGFRRNWWVGLTLLHTLFIKEHNSICTMLGNKYPGWDDDRLFNVARLVNAAVIAKIHTVEWTPAILPNRVSETVLNANWYGLATNFLRSRSEYKTLSSINVANPEIGGVVGNPTNDHGVPYSLTEEFVEVYRLHSLLPESLAIRQCQVNGIIEQVPLPSTRQAGARKLLERMSMQDLLCSFGKQLSGALVLNNYPGFMQEFSVTGNAMIDLGAIDILRARERGVPRYNNFRRQLGLNPICSFSDLTDDPCELSKLREVYGEDVESLDLLIGTLAEAPDRRPDGFGFGETLFQIFILNATRRLQADRFYTTCYNERTYTAEGLDWIDNANLKSVLLRHYPDLSSTGLSNINNAFEPWDEGIQLDPARHPLREFDHSLGPDPWRGGMYR